MKLNSLILSILVLSLTACVELKDVEDVEAEVLSNEITAEHQGPKDLLVEEDLYLYRGAVFTALEFADLVGTKDFAEDEQLSYEYVFKRIEINPGKTLYTMGSSALIKADELISDNGTVATFPKGETANENTPGRSGGHIYLKATKAEGFLRLIMRGEAGGRGLKGDPPTAALRGSDGAFAIGNSFMCDNSFGNNKSPNGGPGKQGFRGKQGAKGGDTGTLEVDVPQSLRLQITKEAGIGGEPGPGGDGGEGGRPGRSNCWVISATKGSQGLPGEPGLPGTPGQELPVCVRYTQEYVCR